MSEQVNPTVATPAAAPAPAPAPAPAADLPQPDPSLFNEGNVVKAQFVKWGKVGDYFEGTLHEVRKVPSTLPGQEGEMQPVYDFVVRSGYFHDKVVEKLPDGTDKVSYNLVKLTPGEYWSLGGGNKRVDDGMRRVKIGQIFGVRLTEVKPSKKKGFADQKVRNVYPGKMDESYLAGGETGASVPVEEIEF